MPFTFERMTTLPEVVKVTPQRFDDNRGTFIEAYKASDFADFGLTDDFVQDNLSVSTRGVLRGLHYQNPPHAQAKLVRCVSGRIWDVAVDIRQGSATYGQWAAAELTADNMAMLYVPVGFAHGFLVLSDTAHVMYKTSGYYDQPSDAGVLWSDPALAIDWPSVGVAFNLSVKDQQLPCLAQANNQFAMSTLSHR
jgi:dTDP-4-dehydrorhamnose 3,5-epimerase